MLLDWLTLKLRSAYIADQQALSDYRNSRPHVTKFTPATGVVEWTVATRESIRTDSHQITVGIGEDIDISGSPARSKGQRNNVFGSLDVVQAAFDHIAAAEAATGIPLPRDLSLYRVTRVDVTCNYDMGGDHEVRQALAYLQQTDGGRYKLKSKAGSVYWSPSSRMRAGKAYAKGPHAWYQRKRCDAQYTADELRMLEGVLRLELKLGGEWWRRARNAGRNWWEFTAEDFLTEHESYFGKLIGSTEISNMKDVRVEIWRVAPTEGQAEKAYATWGMIQAFGHAHVREMTKKRTWYRHLRILQDAGLGWGDICAGRVVQLRKTPLVIGQPLSGWNDLKKAA